MTPNGAILLAYLGNAIGDREMTIINEIAESMELTENDNRYWSEYLERWVTVPGKEDDGEE
jgi:hypothetical protein